MTIEKIIHYCWFGNGELSDIEKECIASWSKIHPDWKIQRWDETNFPLDEHPFAREAYEEKKWAFVSDYARIYALGAVGGGISRHRLQAFKAS